MRIKEVLSTKPLIGEIPIVRGPKFDETFLDWERDKELLPVPYKTGEKLMKNGRLYYKGVTYYLKIDNGNIVKYSLSDLIPVTKIQKI